MQSEKSSEPQKQEVVETKPEVKVVAVKSKKPAAKKKVEPKVAAAVKKSEPLVEKTVPAVLVEKPKPMANSKVIWEKIKDLDLGLFGLGGQLVSRYCELLPLDDEKCYLKYKVSSVVPALETVAPEYDIEVVQGYIVLSNKKV
jgi:hypothetical protein